MTSPLFSSNLTSLVLVQRGKVRDIYAVDAAHMLIVTTDRLSAFDVVLPTPIPDKGTTLTALSNFWFAHTAHIVPNHLSGIEPESVVQNAQDRAQIR
ncbi:MAG: phosphoribosylaminoimidazolesuccinocarboxamide synthase, partial [Gammaproteobacteria bacterium]